MRVKESTKLLKIKCKQFIFIWTSREQSYFTKQEHSLFDNRGLNEWIKK